MVQTRCHTAAANSDSMGLCDPVLDVSTYVLTVHLSIFTRTLLLPLHSPSYHCLVSFPSFFTS